MSQGSRPALLSALATAICFLACTKITPNPAFSTDARPGGGAATDAPIRDGGADLGGGDLADAIAGSGTDGARDGTAGVEAGGACASSAECKSAERPICEPARSDCVPCASDAQCKAKSASTTVCASGRCVECKGPADCSGATPACHPTTARCVACAADTDCTAAARPICDKARNECTGCSQDADCRARTPAAPVCLMDGRCVPCKASSDCSGATPVCAVATNRCVACTDDSHCASPDRPICDRARSECVPCAADAQCEARSPVSRGCTAGRCVACTKSDHCPTATSPICGASNTCGPCTTDAQCAARSPTGPGVCMSHDDGRCATDAETLHVAAIPSCSPTGGSRSAPLCQLQQGTAAAAATGKRLIVVRGPSAVDSLVWSSPSPPLLSVVGQEGATLVGGAFLPGIQVTGGRIFVRGVDVVQSAKTGVVVTGGATLRMERCRIQRNSQGAFFSDGGGFELTNVLMSDNGVGDDSGATFVGLRVKNLPAGQPKVLRRVSVIGAGNPGLSCTQQITSEGVLVNGTATLLISPACAITPCTTPGPTCGSDLPP